MSDKNINNPRIGIIVAIGRDGAIGRNGNLIWRIPADLKRFKEITLGHPIIMGRKTWESLPKRPLPGRRNIILSKNPQFMAEGAEIVSSIEQALEITKDETPFVIGGASIYETFLPFADGLYLTVVEGSCDDADAFFNPDLNDGWQLIEESEPASTQEGVEYRYLTYRRKP
ncbi:MAG: dihydrofolate reductase [Muribaculaceae bacterium]|nr:dihydrofolate reductase [Muribaculaceae bacterium]